MIELTVEIVSAFVSHNEVRPDAIPGLIAEVHAALMRGASNAQAAEEPEKKPAVSIRTSVKPDHLVCLEDGKKFKSLKRHLRTDHDMSPDEYRARWGLNQDYPMVAPSYAQARSDLAKAMGLGRKAAEPAPVSAKPAPAKPARTRRSRKQAEAAE